MATLSTSSGSFTRPFARIRNLFRRTPRDPRLPKPFTPEWEREARRQAKHIASSPGEPEDIAFVDSLYEPDDEY